MNLQQLSVELNIVKQAKKYGIPLWQHPQFLFLVMGILIILSSIFSYFLGRRYLVDPQIVALSIIVLSIVLLILAFIITKSFERLAQAARLKSEFVSVVSHQLRAPLSNMKWIADLLVSGTENANQKEYFQMLKENSSRMQNLVNDLLMVSRIEEGGLATQNKEFIFQDVLLDVVSNFQPVIKASNLVVKIETEKNIKKVFADPLQIRQAISNLLDNAIKYTGKTKKAVLQDKIKERIITLRIKDKKKHLRFEIEDTGVGIPKEDQKYIFQKFFRSDNVMRHETEGTGLGLYIAHSTITKSKGEIGFDSKEDKGSTFWFTIPYAL
ncbi:MAG: HAMP domain-containing histidine kinase [Nanoarchaeota archaeon]|nr:HAMP domain-containing histidine kinase [Nanoarchaeota archaeon]